MTVELKHAMLCWDGERSVRAEIDALRDVLLAKAGLA